ncbi:MAG: RHS repeat-associated core domain-containing protein [Phycisphaerales bacterium]|nr:RHS repeat-associated core domain-containing protein [Phycisphaerales bacterium]
MNIEYGFDQLGRRIERRKYTWQTANPPASWTLAESTRYVWSDWLLLMELDGLQGNAVLRKYTWGLDLAGLNGAGASGGAGILPAGLTGAGGIGGLLAVYDTNGTTTGQNPEADDMSYAYLYNANGDVGQVVDPNAASAAASLVARYEYDPYGGVIFASGSYAASNAWRFSTKQFDPVTGLGYWGYRWYSAKLGRWISRDPIEEAGGRNLARYVNNAPGMRWDALGLRRWCCDECEEGNARCKIALTLAVISPSAKDVINDTIEGLEFVGSVLGSLSLMTKGREAIDLGCNKAFFKEAGKTGVLDAYEGIMLGLIKDAIDTMLRRIEDREFPIFIWYKVDRSDCERTRCWVLFSRLSWSKYRTVTQGPGGWEAADLRGGGAESGRVPRWKAGKPFLDKRAVTSDDVIAALKEAAERYGCTGGWERQ